MLRNELPWSLARLTPYLEAPGGEGGGKGDPPGDPEDPPAGDDPKEKEPPADQKPPGEKKYTDEDVDRMINQKFAKWQSDQQKKIDEAKKLGEMNAEEKAAYAQKQAEEAQAQLDRYKMMSTARGMLAEKNITLADNLLEVLVDAEADKTKENIDSFIALFEKAVNAEVEKRMRGKTPPAGAGAKTLTKEEIMKIEDPVARQTAIAENLKLFE